VVSFDLAAGAIFFVTRLRESSFFMAVFLLVKA
jgi:hypothetical protein